MRPIAAMLLVSLTVTGCAAQVAREPAPPRPSQPAGASLASLDGSEWRFVELAGQPVPVGINATLRLRGGRAAGKAGCNAYGARYHIAADGSTRFEQTLSTKMTRLQPTGVMRVEQDVFNAFRNTAKVAIVDGDLMMLDTAGKPLVKLAPAGSP